MKTKIAILFPLVALLLLSTIACDGKNESEMRYKIGLQLQIQGHIDMAITEYTNAILLDPELVEAYVNRAIAYISKGQYDQAIADCNKAIELKPDIVEGYSTRASTFMWKGQYDQAIADCNKVIALEYNNARAYFVRGTCYAEQGKKAEAISDLEACISFSQNPSVIQAANATLQELR